MYRLVVFHAGSPTPTQVQTIARAADVLERIPELLKSHPTCDRVEVHFNGGKLFAVDCAGHQIR